MKKLVDHPRVISGLLAEIEASESLLFCKSESNSWLSKIKVQLKAPYENTLIELSDPREVIKVSCESTLHNRRISFDLIWNESSRSFLLPEQITVQDLRSSYRLQLRDENLFAEVRSLGTVSFGEAQDVSTDFVSILLHETSPNLEVGAECHVHARSRTHLRDVYFANCVLKSLSPNERGTKAVFQVKTKTANPLSSPRTRRYTVEPFTIRFVASDLSVNRIYGEIQVEEVSLSGFLGRIRGASLLSSPIVGLILNCDEPRMSFSAVRKVGDRVAFQVCHTCSDSKHASWYDFIEERTDSTFKSVVSAAELATLFTESTFVKGNRRRSFGKKVENHFFDSNTDANGKLLRRFVGADDGANISHHISVFRLTDSAWYLQEVISGIHKLHGVTELKERVIKLLAEEARFLRYEPQFFTGMYDPTIPANEKQWGHLVASENHVGVRAAHISLDQENKPGSSSLSTITADQLSTAEKFEVSQRFNLRILEILDFWSKCAANRVLNQELRRIGPGHRAVLYCIKDEAGVVQGLVYRLNTYYAANATGVVNSIFVFLPKDTTAHAVSEIKRFVGQVTEFRLGSSDLLMIGSDLNPVPYSDKKKEFIWFAVDLLKYEEPIAQE